MRFRLRTLMILLAVGPPLLWAAWLLWDSLRPSPPPPDKGYYMSHKILFDVF